jgi:hypothetical protein
LSPQISAAAQPIAIQALTDPNSGQAIIQVDQSGPGTSAIDLVPELALLGLALPDSTAFGLVGQFLHDDGIGVALRSRFRGEIASARNATVGSLVTWLTVSDGSTAGVGGNGHGPPPSTISGAVWGLEAEVTRIDRFDDTFIAGGNPSMVLRHPARTSLRRLQRGLPERNVGAACANDAPRAQSISLDSTALSVGRGRRDIANLTQAGQIDIPVIAFGGSNGLVPVPGLFTSLATSLGLCTAPSCTGTARVVDAALPTPAFPTFGGVAGGFEVHISLGFAHNDVVTAEDIPANNVLAPLSDFLARNVQ